MEEPAHTTSLWQGIVVGGPILMALHWCMAILFCAAVVLAFRRTGTLTAFACCLAPFFFGTVALWIGVVSHTAMFPEFSGGLYDGDPRENLRLMQRPFFIGTGLSSVAFLVFFFARRLRPKVRPA
ncbi:MAG: hypothetical protein P4L99_12825 [Chthoniobacter sp.]|nr:hypothetical protein [Chthoniobacter sp.]